MLAFRNSAVRAIDIAIEYVRREEVRLRGIIESGVVSEEERFQALQDLAYLSTMVVRELADMRTQSTLSGLKGESDGAFRQLFATSSPAVEEVPYHCRKTEGHAAIDEKAESTFHKDVCDNLPEGVYFVDRQRRITYWNRGAKDLSGFDRDEAIGRHCYDDFLRHTDAEGRVLCYGGCPLAETLEDGKAREGEVFLRHKCGHKVPVAVRVSPVVNHSGELIGAVEVFSNITSRKVLEHRATELEKLAYCDALTDVSNRRHIELKLQQAQQEVDQFERKAGLLLLDLDRFKTINDIHGHDGGDAVLKSVAHRLRGVLREGDSIGRWGGEEFLYVAMNVSLEDLEEIGERCRSAIEVCTVPLSEGQAQVTASIGAAVLKKGERPEKILKRADELLYMSKCRGGNAVRARL